MNLPEYGLPSVEDAFTNACDQIDCRPEYRVWIHSAVWKAVCSVTFQAMKYAEPGNSEHDQFEAAYLRYCAHVVAGEQIDIPQDQGRALDITPPNQAKEKIESIREAIK